MSGKKSGGGSARRTISAMLLCVLTGTAMALTSAAGQRGQVRTQGYLGIGFRDLSDNEQVAQHVGKNVRVEVGMVDHDGPAGKAGIHVHDLLISVNGQPVANSDTLHRMIQEAGAGTALSMLLQRGATTLVLTATLGNREEIERQALKNSLEPQPGDELATPNTVIVETFTEERGVVPSGATPAGPAVRGQSFMGSMLHMTPFTGLGMEEMTPQLSGFFGTPEKTGLLVCTVLSGSPAATAGLRAGDIVLKADAIGLRSTSDWTKKLHASKGRPIVLTVLRDKQSLQVTIQPGTKAKSSLEWPMAFSFR